MANHDAVDLFNKNVQSGHLGNVIAVHGSKTPSAAGAADKIRLCKIPAGFEAFRLTIKNADLDSNGAPTLTCKVGYEHVDGTTGDDDAFVATGSTILQSASGVAGNTFVVKPVRIEKDAILVITVVAGALTFAAGEVTGILEGIGLGAK